VSNIVGIELVAAFQSTLQLTADHLPGSLKSMSSLRGLLAAVFAGALLVVFRRRRPKPS
jgi:hypothetical protein